jgi:hypothetical protein
MRLMRGFAKCNFQHEALCQAVADHVCSRWKSKGTKSGYRVEDLCELCWILCVLQAYHDELLKLMFKQLIETPTLSNDALCQVYECHLAHDSERKETYSPHRPDAETVQKLAEHYKEHRRDDRRGSDRQRSDVGESLKSLTEAHVKTNHRTSSGLLVDVAALRKKSSTDGFVHVEMDTPGSMVRPLDADVVEMPGLIVEGPIAFKRRIIQNSGLKVVVVREVEWKALSETKEKRRHLRSLLANLGASLGE